MFFILKFFQNSRDRGFWMNETRMVEIRQIGHPWNLQRDHVIRTVILLILVDCGWSRLLINVKSKIASWHKASDEFSIVAIWDIINFYSGPSVGTEEFWSVYWWVMFRLSCLVFLVFPEVFTRYKAGPEQILQTQQCMALFSSTVREAFKNAKFSGF